MYDAKNAQSAVDLQVRKPSPPDANDKPTRPAAWFGSCTRRAMRRGRRSKASSYRAMTSPNSDNSPPGIVRRRWLIRCWTEPVVRQSWAWRDDILPVILCVLLLG